MLPRPRLSGVRTTLASPRGFASGNILMWEVGHKATPLACELADRHYSRRKVGAPQMMPPGQTLVLVRPGGVFGWWRPHPTSGLRAMNGLDGWTCTIFRNETTDLSSKLILEAERLLAGRFECGPSGLLTYVWDSRIRSANPGCCFKKAGWVLHPTKPRSADGRKSLLWKPFERAGKVVDGDL